MRSCPLVAIGAALLLAACDSSAPEEETAAADRAGPPGASLPAARVPAGPTPAELALLEDRDCRVVAQAYVDALSRSAFDYAAEFWDDPVIDGDRLSALFASYVTPRVMIADVQEEGAAGTLYCTVTGAVTDASDPRVAPAQGQIVLSRVNDVPGATEEQLRWTIGSSTFIEPMERSSRGTPG